MELSIHFIIQLKSVLQETYNQLQEYVKLIHDLTIFNKKNTLRLEISFQRQSWLVKAVITINTNSTNFTNICENFTIFWNDHNVPTEVWTALKNATWFSQSPVLPVKIKFQNNFHNVYYLNKKLGWQGLSSPRTYWPPATGFTDCADYATPHGRQH